jgi:Spy/CpxP family protein refolding chaperone
MKNMIRIIALGAAVFTLAVGAMAQTPGPKGNKQEAGVGKKAQGGKVGFEGRVRGMRSEMMEKLNLTPDQKQKMEALEKSTQTKVQTIMNSQGDREAKMTKMREVMKEHREGMNKILTKQQQAQLEKMMQEAREKRRKEGKGFGGPGGPGGPASAGKKKSGGG